MEAIWTVISGYIPSLFFHLYLDSCHHKSLTLCSHMIFPEPLGGPCGCLDCDPVVANHPQTARCCCLHNFGDSAGGISRAVVRQGRQESGFPP